MSTHVNVAFDRFKRSRGLAWGVLQADMNLLFLNFYACSRKYSYPGSIFPPVHKEAGMNLEIESKRL